LASNAYFSIQSFITGNLFDLKDFHYVVLENGAVPLSTLETIVDSWIERVKTDNSRTSGELLSPEIVMAYF
jgi:hypothetical protein